jgi:oxygen-independent coproporphyrinogen III oxidase
MADRQHLDHQPLGWSCGESAMVLAERRVPRYTSYPTAPHFTPEVGPATYLTWLAELAPETTLSLYLHVPYCIALCHYCGCHTKAVRRRNPIDSYADRLIDEIVLVGRSTASRRIMHLHWGGGTPSILGPERLIAIAAKLNEVFDLRSIRTHAIELDPRYVSQSLVLALKAMGINRVSLGVQDFTPRVQQAIGRVQPIDVVKNAVALLRDAGIDQINFDLMYGLPQQMAQDIQRNMLLAASFKPQRIALFGYAHVPWFRHQQRLIDEATLPGPLERMQQFEMARDLLTALGYQPVGLDHFAYPSDDLAIAARAGTLRRNFQGYTTDDAEALIGVGSSAIGRLPQGFVQNASETGAYSRALLNGKLATKKGIVFLPEDQLRGRVIERLMCDLRVDLQAIAGDSAAHLASELDSLKPLQAEGLLCIERFHVRVTEKGRPFARLVAAAFDPYFGKSDAARHAVAV